MKNILTCILLGTALATADDIEVHVTTKTNRVGSVVTKEYFTRGGETNLLRSTTTTNGIVTSRLYRFYHDHKRVADYINGTRGYSFVQTYNGFSFGITSTNNMLIEACISDKDDHVLDLFVSTNGVLFPMPTSELRKYLGEGGKYVTDGDEPVSQNGAASRGPVHSETNGTSSAAGSGRSP